MQLTERLFMNTYYLKNYSKNYMILEDFPEYKYSSDFRLKMITNNHINNTLCITYEINNNMPVFKYNITSLQSISTIYENKTISLNEYLSIITSLIDVMDELEKYLFDINSIIIRTNYVYMDPENYSTYFTICPAWNQDFYSELKSFFEDLLNKIDHSNERLVFIAYKLCTESAKEEFNLSMIKSILYEKNCKKNNKDSYENNYENGYKNSYEHNYENENENNYENDCKNNCASKLSGSFKIKIVCFLTIFILLIMISINLCMVKGITNSLSILFIFISCSYFIGAFKYLLLLYPESVETNEFGFSNTSIPLENSPENLSRNSSENTTDYLLQKDKDLIIDDDSVHRQFGKTEVLEPLKKNSHHLIYIGTDYSHNVEVKDFPFKIGKLPDSVQMIINNPLISRIHACLYAEDNQFYIEDLNSTNGTFINGTLLSPHCREQIHPGDQITFSHITYLFE